MPEPLTPVEESLLSTYLTLASKDDALLKALQASFNATFDLATTKKSATSFAKDFDLNRHHVSTLFLDNISVVVSKFPKEAVLEGIDHPSFGPVSSNTLLKELMMAWHTRLNHDHPHYDELIKRMGVIYNSESRLLLVNFHRYLPYRRSLSPALDEALPADVRSGDVDLATQARVLVRLYEDAYHSVVPVEGVGSYRNIYYGEGTAWDPEEWAGTLFVDVDAYRKIVAFAAKTELGRILGVPMATRRRASAQHMVATRTPKGFVDYYENPQTGEQLRFYVIRIGNHVYFSPPWEVPEEERFRPVRGYKGSGEKTRIRDDVKFVKLLKLWFYRYDLMMQQKGVPLGAIPGLRDGLYTWSTYDKDNFAALMRRKRKLVDTTRRRQQKDDLRGVRFTPEEDKVILDHYRPGMSFDDERIIFEVCGTRTPHAVSNRARFLCNQLLAAGVYDLNKLPHRRYNHRLITRIKKAVIENGDDLEKVLEDVRKARQIYLGVHRGSDGDAGEADGEREDSSEAEAREES